MASAVPPPQQSAPTVGPTAVLAGVMIRTGNFIKTGERVVSGLVQRSGLCDYVSDNAGSLRRAGGVLWNLAVVRRGTRKGGCRVTILGQAYSSNMLATSALEEPKALLYKGGLDPDEGIGSFLVPLGW